MKKFLLSLVAMGSFALTGFAADNTPAPPTPQPPQPAPCLLLKPGTGVDGRVDRGPTSPVVRPGQPNSAPMANTEIVIKDHHGKVVARTKTDANGFYELKLKPGKYTVVGPRSGIRPGHWTKQVEVKSGWTKVDIHIDTGIRTPVRQANGGGVALGVVYKIDLGATLPKTLTVKVGESIVFVKANVPGGRIYAGYKVDDNGQQLLKQAKIRIYPPRLVGNSAGKGKLIVEFRSGHPQAAVQTHEIDLTVIK